jgi:hypothetical protein
MRCTALGRFTAQAKTNGAEIVRHKIDRPHDIRVRQELVDQRLVQVAGGGHVLHGAKRRRQSRIQRLRNGDRYRP